MLLSQLIKISKCLNESLKCKFFDNINNFFEDTTLVKIEKKLNGNTYRDSTDIKYTLSNSSYKKSDLENIDFRRELLNAKYETKKFNIIKNLKSRYWSHSIQIPFDEITDLNIKEIDLKDVRKKKYSQFLCFWFRHDMSTFDIENPLLTKEYLTAITLGNDILCLIHSKYDVHYDVNPNFKFEHDGLIDFDRDEIIKFGSSYGDVKMNEFINKAFIKYKSFEMTNGNMYNGEKVKVIDLMNDNSISSVKYINIPNKSESIMTKVNSRDEYKNYLESIKDLNKKNIKRYKEKIQVNKTLNNFLKYSNLCDEVILNYQIVSKKITTLLQKFITDNKVDHDLEYNVAIRSYQEKEGRRYVYKHEYAHTIGEAIVQLNLYINSIFDYTFNLKDYILLFNLLENDDELKKAYLINYIKSYYTNLLTLLDNQTQTKYKDCIKASNGFIPNDITEELDDLKKKYPKI